MDRGHLSLACGRGQIAWTPFCGFRLAAQQCLPNIKKVRFPDWQHTSQGERLVQKELRKALLKYKLHTDQDLFDRAYAYIKQYY